MAYILPERGMLQAQAVVTNVSSNFIEARLRNSIPGYALSRFNQTFINVSLYHISSLFFHYRVSEMPVGIQVAGIL